MVYSNFQQSPSDESIALTTTILDSSVHMRNEDASVTQTRVETADSEQLSSLQISEEFDENNYMSVFKTGNASQ